MNEEAFLDQYDDIAVDVVSDDRPNTDADLSYSNVELVENICAATGWESFDLLGRFDFDEVYASKDPKAVLAHAFISFLRWRLFRAADAAGVGNQEFNARAVAYSEYWYIALVRRWNEMSGGPDQKAWLH